MESEFIEVPYERLSPETLHRLVEEFVLREGTDYGHREFSLDEKVNHVLGQLRKGMALVAFDPRTESCNIVVKN